MTYKPFEYDPHARLRMKERGTTRADVQWLVKEGQVEPTEGVRHHRSGWIKGGEVKVAYLENAHRIYVITVMWVE